MIDEDLGRSGASIEGRVRVGGSQLALIPLQGDVEAAGDEAGPADGRAVLLRKAVLPLEWVGVRDDRGRINDDRGRINGDGGRRGYGRRYRQRGRRGQASGT